ncbi:MAG: hypothetical protein U0359_41735 [Byssovorax sp.]
MLDGIWTSALPQRRRLRWIAVVGWIARSASGFTVVFVISAPGLFCSMISKVPLPGSGQLWMAT